MVNGIGKASGYGASGYRNYGQRYYGGGYSYSYGLYGYGGSETGAGLYQTEEPQARSAGRRRKPRDQESGIN